VAYHEVADAAMYGPGLDWDEDEPEFPEDDGPVFAVGGCALVDAVWAAVGEDPLGDVLGVLVPLLGDAVPGLDDQVPAAVAADPLQRAAEVLSRLCRSPEAVPGGAFSEVVVGSEGVSDGRSELINPVRGMSGGGRPVGSVEGAVGGHGDGPSVLVPVGVAHALQSLPVVDPGDLSLMTISIAEARADSVADGLRARSRPLRAAGLVVE